MRLLLIQTPNVTGTLLNLPGKELPLSLLYLAAYARQAGHEVRVLDLDVLGGRLSHLDDAWRTFAPQLVGLSAYTTNVARAAAIAEWVKQRDASLPTVLGGFHASALPEQTLIEFPALDYVVAGEGEQTLAELAAALQAGQPAATTPGVYSRRDGQVVAGPVRPLIEDLDTIPWPARELLPVRRYVPDPGNFYRLPSSSILYSRGCPLCCAFCSKAVFHDTVRYRRPEQVVEEMRACGRDFAVRDFRFVDEGPTIHRKRMRALCEAILGGGLDVTWHCYSRVDTVNEDDLRLMQRAGCYHVTYGIESGSPRTLERIDKRLDLDAARRIIATTRRLGLECKANFIIGFPWETHEDIDQTLRFVYDSSPDLATINVFKPLPGSRLYEELRQASKLRHTKWEDYFATSEFLLFESNFTDAEMKKILKRAILKFHLRPRFIAQRLRRLLRHPRRELLTLRLGLKIVFANLFR
jgi:radical SAM superfamily enzyme YgiQ (UPF0313 family)